GEPELARDYAQRLVSQDPGDVEARRLAAGLDWQAGDPASDLTHYQALLRRDRDDMLALAGVSIALTATEGAIHWPSLERLVTMLLGAPAAPRAACVGLYQRVIPTMESAGGNLHLAAGLALLALG